MRAVVGCALEGGCQPETLNRKPLSQVLWATAAWASSHLVKREKERERERERVRERERKQREREREKKEGERERGRERERERRLEFRREKGLGFSGTSA